MIARLLPWSLLFPVALPLLICLLAAVVRSPRWLGWLALVGLLGGILPLLPFFGLPATTPAVPWVTIDDATVPFQLSQQPAGRMPRGAMAALLLVAGAVGLWSLPRLYEGVHREGRRDEMVSYPAGAAGVLLSIAGAELAVLGVAPLGAVIGLGILLLGTLVVEVAGTPGGEDHAFSGVVPVAIALLLLVLSTFGASTVTLDRLFWILGCLLLTFTGPLRLAIGRASLPLHGMAEALGMTPVAAWLLIATPSGNTAITIGGYDFMLVLGSLAFALGAINTVASTTLRGLIGGQWTAQLGLLLMVFGSALGDGGTARAAVWPALATALVSTFVLSLTVGKLVLHTGVEGMADLPAPRVPLRLSSVAYGLAAASIIGLPFTPGYMLRQTLAVADAPVYMAPLLLGGSSLLLVGLAIPLAAFVRRPALRPAGSGRDERVFNGGLPIDEEPGWALPFAGLRQTLFLLTATPWEAAARRGVAALCRAAAPVAGLSNLVERRYYLGLLVVATLSIALLAAGGNR